MKLIGVDGCEDISVECCVKDENDRIINRVCTDAQPLTQFSVHIESPCLWTPEKPYLYKLVFEYNGEVKTLIEWAEIAGVRKDTFRRRIVNNGWTLEEAINTPNLRGKAKIHHRNWRQ